MFNDVLVIYFKANLLYDNLLTDTRANFHAKYIVFVNHDNYGGMETFRRYK